jgi:hypothetical protein
MDTTTDEIGLRWLHKISIPAGTGRTVRLEDIVYSSQMATGATEDIDLSPYACPLILLTCYNH